METESYFPIGSVYKITRDDGMIYIGSSRQVNQRRDIHFHTRDSQFFHEKATFEILEDVAYIDKSELRMYEQMYIETIPIELRLNHRKAFSNENYDLKRSPNSSNCNPISLEKKRAARRRHYHKLHNDPERAEKERIRNRERMRMVRGSKPENFKIPKQEAVSETAKVDA